MTQEEYDDYVEKVDDFYDKNDIAHISVSGPAFFDKTPCDCCKSSLHGDREQATVITKKDEKFLVDLCIDCVYYIECGLLPDDIMPSQNW